jgi:hypothetical protein
MLTGLSRQRYETFQQALAQLQSFVSQNNVDGTTLQAEFLEVQQFFQLQIISLELDSLNPVEAAYVQSIQTEINKQLRLLGMDVMFLQAARQSVTAQKRQVQMRDRLTQLMQYCEALLANKE